MPLIILRLAAYTLITLSLLYLAAKSNAAAPAVGPAKVDLASTLKPILAKHKIPGLLGAIVDGDQVTALGAVGVRKAGSPELMTAGDVIHLGSDTKAMTALLVGQMIENKQLTFDTTMEHIFPDLAGHMRPAMAKVTIGQLLNHTSGLPANVPDWWAYDRSHETLAAQRRAVAKDMLALEPSQPPGTHYDYSNVGYVILGAILEQKSGLPWEELITQKLFQPLKMKSAGFGPPGTVGKVDEPWGHVLEKGVLKPLQEDNAPVMGPAGRVHCTLSDWAKFVAQYLQPHGDEPALLGAAIQRQLITPRAGMDYAGGWLTTERSWGGGTVLTHAGSNTMWYCVAWVAPKKDFAVLAATNVAGDDASTACDEAAAAMIQVHAKQNPRGP